MSNFFQLQRKTESLPRDREKETSRDYPLESCDVSALSHVGVFYSFRVFFFFKARNNLTHEGFLIERGHDRMLLYALFKV